MKREKPDPYCAFKDDKERRIALISKNVCGVAIAVVIGVVIIYAPPSDSGLLTLLKTLLSTIK